MKKFFILTLGIVFFLALNGCEEEQNKGDGCTDPAAYNYDPAATIDDGSCDYGEEGGCTDPYALNYDPDADFDDGTCQFGGGFTSTCTAVDHLGSTSELTVCVQISESNGEAVSIDMTTGSSDQPNQTAVIESDKACAVFPISSYGNYAGIATIGSNSVEWSTTVTSQETQCSF